MDNGQIVRFKIGEAFPADDQLARWMTVCAMALNDLFLVNRWLFPRLEEKIPSEPDETFYLGRAAAAHLFEAAAFLRRTERIPPVKEFVGSLDETVQADYRDLIELAKNGTGKFQDQLKHARNAFFHYPKILVADEDYERLKEAMADHASDEQEQGTRRGEIRDIPPPITGFRAIFADDIASEVMLPKDTENEFRPFLGNVAAYSVKLLTFVRAALNAYTHTRPEGTWDIEEVAGSSTLDISPD